MGRYFLASLFVVLYSLVAYAQAGSSISGSVSSGAGEALIGVNIVVRGTATGTVTDENGRFSLMASPSDVLYFSYTGYKSVEVAVGNQSVINVTLEENVEILDEVVVVGYGTQRKEDLTGAVSVVNTEELTKQASNDVTQMMQGRVAGVSITSDGQPGATPSVRVRGVSTFGLGAGAEPLYVVDGFPLAGASGTSTPMTSNLSRY